MEYRGDPTAAREAPRARGTALAGPEGRENPAPLGVHREQAPCRPRRFIPTRWQEGGCDVVIPFVRRRGALESSAVRGRSPQNGGDATP